MTSRHSWQYEDAITHDDIAITSPTFTLISENPAANIGNARFNPEEQKIILFSGSIRTTTQIVAIEGSVETTK